MPFLYVRCITLKVVTERNIKMSLPDIPVITQLVGDEVVTVYTSEGPRYITFKLLFKLLLNNLRNLLPIPTTPPKPTNPDDWIDEPPTDPTDPNSPTNETVDLEPLLALISKLEVKVDNVKSLTREECINLLNSYEQALDNYKFSNDIAVSANHQLIIQLKESVGTKASLIHTHTLNDIAGLDAEIQKRFTEFKINLDEELARRIDNLVIEIHEVSVSVDQLNDKLIKYIDDLVLVTKNNIDNDIATKLATIKQDILQYEANVKESNQQLFELTTAQHRELVHSHQQIVENLANETNNLIISLTDNIKLVELPALKLQIDQEVNSKVENVKTEILTEVGITVSEALNVEVSQRNTAIKEAIDTEVLARNKAIAENSGNGISSVDIPVNDGIAIIKGITDGVLMTRTLLGGDGIMIAPDGDGITINCNVTSLSHYSDRISDQSDANNMYPVAVSPYSQIPGYSVSGRYTPHYDSADITSYNFSIQALAAPNLPDSLGSGAIDLQLSRTSHSRGAIGKNSITIGLDNLTNDEEGVAIGNNNSIFATCSYSLGKDNWINGAFNNVAIGVNNRVSGKSDVVIGTNNASSFIGSMDSAESNVTIIGHGNRTSKVNALVVGKENNIQASDAICYGVSNVANGANGVVIGTSSEANGTNSVAVGVLNKINGTNGTAVGYNINLGTNANHNYIVGSNLTSNSPNNIAIGQISAISNFSNSVLMGNFSASKASDIVIGWSNNWSTTFSNSGAGMLHIGNGARYASNMSTANLLAIGHNLDLSNASPPASVIIGNDITIGSSDSFNTSHTVCVGYNIRSKGNATVSIGDNSTSQQYSVSVGSGSNSFRESVAIGRFASTNGSGSVSIGISSTSTSGSVAIGYSVKSGTTFGAPNVVIGASSGMFTGSGNGSVLLGAGITNNGANGYSAFITDNANLNAVPFSEFSPQPYRRSDPIGQTMQRGLIIYTGILAAKTSTQAAGTKIYITTNGINSNSVSANSIRPQFTDNKMPTVFTADVYVAVCNNTLSNRQVFHVYSVYGAVVGDVKLDIKTTKTAGYVQAGSDFTNLTFDLERTSDKNGWFLTTNSVELGANDSMRIKAIVRMDG